MMSKAMAEMPATDFAVPPGVVTGVPICADSGRLAGGCREVEYSAFVRGSEPTVIDPRTRPGQALPAPAAAHPRTAGGSRRLRKSRRREGSRDGSRPGCDCRDWMAVVK
jgi:hypothetical protein